MIDIVERLRLSADIAHRAEMYQREEMLNEAAAEIGLRRADIGGYVIECAELRQEIERLRTDRKAMQEQLAEEIGRGTVLRATLRRIKSLHFEDGQPPTAWELAERALGQERAKRKLTLEEAGEQLYDAEQEFIRAANED